MNTTPQPDALRSRWTLQGRVPLSRIAEGAVWHRARSIATGEDVVLFVVRGEAALEAADAVRRAYLVEDPHLLPVKDIVVLDDPREDAPGTSGAREGDGPTTVVEYALPPAPPLAALLADGPLHPETARSIIGEAATGLEVARRRGVRHQLLDSNRVFVDTRSGAVVVLGIGVEAASHPELDRSREVASFQDTASLVALLYRALTGRSPRPDATGTVPRPSTVVDTAIPEDLDLLCDLVLNETTEDIPETTRGLIEALQPWQSIPVTLEAYARGGQSAAGMAAAGTAAAEPAEPEPAGSEPAGSEPAGSEPAGPGTGDPADEDELESTARMSAVPDGDDELESTARMSAVPDHDEGPDRGQDPADQQVDEDTVVREPRTAPAGTVPAGSDGNDAVDEDTIVRDRGQQDAAPSGTGGTGGLGAAGVAGAAGAIGAAGIGGAVAAGAASTPRPDERPGSPDRTPPGRTDEVSSSQPDALSPQSGTPSQPPGTASPQPGTTSQSPDDAAHRTDEAAERAAEDAQRSQEEQRTAADARALVEDLHLDQKRGISPFPGHLEITAPPPETTPEPAPGERPEPGPESPTGTGTAAIAGTGAAAAGAAGIAAASATAGAQDAGATAAPAASAPSADIPSRTSGTRWPAARAPQDRTAPLAPAPVTSGSPAPAPQEPVGAATPDRSAATPSHPAEDGPAPAPVVPVAGRSTPMAHRPEDGPIVVQGRDRSLLEERPEEATLPSSSASLLRDVVGVAVDHDEPRTYALGPKDREKRSLQSQWIIIGGAIAVMIALVVALTTITSDIRDILEDPLATSPAPATSAPTEEETDEAPVEPTAEETEESLPAPEISGAELFALPSGENVDHAEEQPLLTDGDTSTHWSTQHYASPDYGGLKDGIGIRVSFAEPSTFTALTVTTAQNNGGLIELRSVNEDGTPGEVLATGEFVGDGEVRLEAPEAMEAESVMLWMPELPPDSDQDGRFRARVAEIQAE